VAACLLIGCGDDDHAASDDDGKPGGHCYPDGTCNAGLSCTAGSCVALDAGAYFDAAVDMPPDAFMCADDSTYEPNDVYTDAVDTDVVALALTRTIPNLAICPGGDQDHFEINTDVAGQNLELFVDFPLDGPILLASILNSSGIPIANASPMTGPPFLRRIRAYTPSLAKGTYYALVYSTNGMMPGVNNYRITLTVTGP
jgi:hypothetical protein